MFLEFLQTQHNVAVESYEANHNANRLTIDIFRQVDRFGSDTALEFICRINGEKRKTIWSKPGSYNQIATLDKAKRALVAIYTKETQQ